MDDLTSTAGLVALGACALALVALGVAVTATVRLRRLRAAQRAVLGEHGQDDLVAHAARLRHEFAALNDYVADVAAGLDVRLATAERRLDGAVTHRALVRYDAYNEMSGRQSTTIALLDAARSGILLSSIAHRDQARLYAKQVVAGVSDIRLSPEEEEALRLATEPPGGGADDLMRVGFLGPEGTNSHEALLATAVGGSAEAVALGSNHDVVLAVQDGRVDRALAPLENSVEGGVNATVDALTFAAPDVVIVGELVHEVHHCLIAAPGTALADVRIVVSHPQGLAQCADALRRLVPDAAPQAVASTAEGVRRAAGEPGTAAIGARLAAARYGAAILAADIEDVGDNATRFVWLAPAGTPPDETPSKSSLVFHGAGDASPGWLVRCLSEFAFRGVNLTRIESRPLRSVLGHYLFHVDLDGAPGQAEVDEAITALRTHCEAVRLLGAYRAAGSVGAVATLPSGHGDSVTS